MQSQEGQWPGARFLMFLKLSRCHEWALEMMGPGPQAHRGYRTAAIIAAYMYHQNKCLWPT